MTYAPDMAGMDDGLLKREMAARLRQMVDALKKAEPGLTNGKIAKLTHITGSALSNYLSGDREPPYLFLAELRRTYGVGIEWVVLGEAHHNAPEFRKKLEDWLLDPVHNGPRRGRPRAGK